MPGMASATAKERRLLLHLQERALRYFLDNQTPAGLMLDRQSNRGAWHRGGLCSTAATGMGWIALALAAHAPYRLLSPREAVLRLRTGMETALRSLPHKRGIVPHFVDSQTGQVSGVDYLSTIETAWLTVGALWSAVYLGDVQLHHLADDLAERIDWNYWTAPTESPLPLIRHGQGRDGRFLACGWDRLNGETVFMYLLATGAADEYAVSESMWSYLRSFPGEAGGVRFNNSDLGLFVFQYGLDLLDADSWFAPNGIDLAADAGRAVEGNYHVCRDLADTFVTYRDYWGLSAGDGPAASPDGYAYRCYAPSGPIDGTAHLTASFASLGRRPDLVLENLDRAAVESRWPLLGRYGYSNVNVDRNWIASDMVGIDAGALVLAFDNFLHHNRVRRFFHALPCVQRGLARAGFQPRSLPTVRAA